MRVNPIRELLSAWDGRMHIVDNMNPKVIVLRSDIDQEETRNYTMNLSKTSTYADALTGHQ